MKACQQLKGFQGIFLFVDKKSLLEGDTLTHF